MKLHWYRPALLMTWLNIPQDATVFAETGGPPILEVDERRLKEFEDYWYGPWTRTEPKICTAQEFSWAAESFPKQSIFGPNLLEVAASRVEAVTANAQLGQYPSRADIRDHSPQHIDARTSFS